MKAFHKLGQKARFRLLDLTANGVAEQVAKGEADFGISSIPELEPNTEFIPLFNDEIVMVCPEDHKLAEISLVNWTDFATEELTIDQILTQAGSESLEHRKPFLMLGELANPFQLNRLNIGPMPIFIVRLENLCRTYCDGIDSRMIQPGIHHVTLARSEGWWETAHLGMATTEQMKKMVSWLSNVVK